jgi:hypothetical protein
MRRAFKANLSASYLYQDALIDLSAYPITFSALTLANEL